MILFVKNTPREYRFAPRVDGKSLVLKVSPVAGEAEIASINDVSLSNNEVVLWDNTNKRFKTTGVSAEELAPLNGAAVGVSLPSKALIVDSSKDLTGLRNLTILGKYKGVDVDVTGVLKGSTLETSSHASVGGDLSVMGFVARSLRLNGVKITSRNNGVDYDVVSRSGSALLYGNLSDDVKVQTASSKHILHRKGTVDYKVWDESNDGSGSGLDADTLDGLQGSQFLRSDTAANMFGSVTMHGKHIAFLDTALGEETWRIQIPNNETDTSLEFYSYQSNFYTLRLLANGSAELRGTSLTVGGNLVMHKGNDGHNSGFDADLLDGLHASSFLKLSGGTMSGRLVLATGLYNGLSFPAMGDGNDYARMTLEAGAGSAIKWKFVIGNDSDDEFLFTAPSNDGLKMNGFKVFHQGNDGSGSGMDADLLDGNQGSYYLNADNFSGEVAPLDINGGPKFYHLASGGNGKAMKFDVLISTILDGSFTYFNFMNNIDQTWPIQSVRVQGSIYSFTSSAERRNTFDGALYRKSTEQWFELSPSISLHLPANGKVMRLQVSNTARIMLSMTVWVSTY